MSNLNQGLSCYSLWIGKIQFRLQFIVLQSCKVCNLIKHITMWKSSFFTRCMECAYYDLAEALDLFVEALFGKKGSQSFAKLQGH